MTSYCNFGGPAGGQAWAAWPPDMTRRAVVSRVIRVQRRYAVRIRPIQLVGLVYFGEILGVFVELCRICTYFSYIECVLRIRLVKLLLIFIKYEPSTVRSNGLAPAFFFVVHQSQSHVAVYYYYNIICMRFFLYHRSTNLPGGNQVDGLPPASRFN